MRPPERNAGLSEGRIELPEKGSVRAWNPTGTVRLACARGRLWVTAEGDARDHVLRAGEAVELGRRCGRGRIVVQALEPSAFFVRPASAPGR